MAEKQAKEMKLEELEQTLCEVWERVLGEKNIGIDDNFFECGGDSMASYELEVEIEDLGLDLPNGVVNEKNTPHLLAEYLIQHN